MTASYVEIQGAQADIDLWDRLITDQNALVVVLMQKMSEVGSTDAAWLDERITQAESIENRLVVGLDRAQRRLRGLI
ncbi:hypothetical protein [Variovorax saccharolyticus]|jgi:hypothetical protein|uniref:hypothetical protein n=1 Tax=Variovorax saccharolyticus TaxID=3053516 RepID=UPI002578342C|nr:MULTISPECIES: hypothetical protein [unclassified Variovorax]MDM0021387.1 hypothetical protein [Variovorax sp. J22R187]MDM0027396.1 hypothetical protein [Variovorax sp. J31P216]